MALSSHPDRTLIIEIGRLRPISNLAGLNAVRLVRGSVADRLQEIISRLQSAQCAIDAAAGWAETVPTFEQLATHDRAPTGSAGTSPERAAQRRRSKQDDLREEIAAADRRAGIGLSDDQLEGIARLLLELSEPITTGDVQTGLPAPKLVGNEVKLLLAELARADVVEGSTLGRGYRLAS